MWRHIRVDLGLGEGEASLRLEEVEENNHIGFGKGRTSGRNRIRHLSIENGSD